VQLSAKLTAASLWQCCLSDTNSSLDDWQSVPTPELWPILLSVTTSSIAAAEDEALSVGDEIKLTVDR